MENKKRENKSVFEKFGETIFLSFFLYDIYYLIFEPFHVSMVISITLLAYAIVMCYNDRRSESFRIRRSEDKGYYFVENKCCIGVFHWWEKEKTFNEVKKSKDIPDYVKYNTIRFEEASDARKYIDEQL